MPITPPYYSCAQPQVIPNPDDLGFDFFTTAGNSSMPMVHPSSAYDPSYEDCETIPSLSNPIRVLTIRDIAWPQCSQPVPQYLHTPPFDQAMVSGSTVIVSDITYAISQGATLPENPLPAPIVSSSGPQRTRQPVREARRHNPIKSTKKVDSRKDGWDQTLVRFRAEFDAIYSVQHGQPSGGLVPETALASVDKFVKDDLKRSVSCSFYCVLVHHFTNLSTWQQPLWNMKAGEGKRSRSVEDYLKCLLKAVRRAESTPALTGGESDKDDTSVAALSRRKCFLSSL